MSFSLHISSSYSWFTTSRGHDSFNARVSSLPGFIALHEYPADGVFPCPSSPFSLKSLEYQGRGDNF